MPTQDEISCLVEYFWDRLKSVYDPEIGVSVVDLGMVYSVDVEKNNEKVNVSVRMTLTSQGCPLSDVIASDVHEVLMGTGKCEKVDIVFTFDPPWNQDMITEEGKMQLGLL